MSTTQDMWVRTPAAVTSAYLRDLAKYDARAALGPLQKVLAGSDDATIPARSARWLADHIGGHTRLVLVRGAGHMVNLTHPAPVNSANTRPARRGTGGHGRKDHTVRHWLPRIGLALGMCLVLLLAYGVFIEPRVILDEERAEVPLPQLEEELAGTEIAVLSDLQLGMWFANHGMVERAVAAAVEADPDVVLLGGDFVYSSDPTIETQIDTLLELIDPLLDSGILTYAVLGNHVPTSRTGLT